MKKTYVVPVDNNLVTIKRTFFDYPQTGVECMFVQITKKTGMKIYATLGEASRSMRKQARACKHGIAPKVLSNLRRCDVRNLWDNDDDEVFVKKNGDRVTHGFFFLTEVAKTYQTRSHEEVLELGRKMRRLGYSNGDLHNGNIGRIGKKLVCIDFGDRSTK